MNSKAINKKDNNKIIFMTKECIGCGLCSDICGNSIIKMKDGFPYIENDELCCSCGHCAAICPKQAICSNDTHNYRSFKIKRIEQSTNNIETLLKSKRSARDFKDEVPSHATIEKIIEYAEKAPSSTNNRKRKYIVVTDKNKIAKIEKSVVMRYKHLDKIITSLLVKIIGLFSKKLSSNLALTKTDITRMKEAYKLGENPIFKNAPVLIFIASPKDDVQAKDDCIIAQQYMMLYAESIGIGSCITGYAQYAHKSVESFVDLPDGYVIYSVGIFGYPKYTYKNEIIYNNKPDTVWI